MATGFRPNRIAAMIFIGLENHSRATGHGVALTDDIGFIVPILSSGRQSFSPDVSYYDGPIPSNEMDFIPGPSTFAVDVRSKSDYGNAAEAESTAKRADYFEAGTLVVWDVDPRFECVRVYRPHSPDDPLTYSKGEIADAEPAVSGWTMELREIFQ